MTANTWNAIDAELEDTLQTERKYRRQLRRCYLKGCHGYGAQKIRGVAANGLVEAHWYCADHADQVLEHFRVLHRILEIPAR